MGRGEGILKIKSGPLSPKKIWNMPLLEEVKRGDALHHEYILMSDSYLILFILVPVNEINLMLMAIFCSACCQILLQVCHTCHPPFFFSLCIIILTSPKHVSPYNLQHFEGFVPRSWLIKLCEIFYKGGQIGV